MIVGSRIRQQLFFVEDVAYKPIAAFERGDAFPESLLKIGKDVHILIETVRLFNDLEVCAERMSQKDCGEYLHRSLRWSHSFWSPHSFSW